MSEIKKVFGGRKRVHFAEECCGRWRTLCGVRTYDKDTRYLTEIAANCPTCVSMYSQAVLMKAMSDSRTKKEMPQTVEQLQSRVAQLEALVRSMNNRMENAVATLNQAISAAKL